ncbi:MAG: hypothetical protein GY790_05705 [Bacteroidetes bacterium]|nr:hypothetical protein [Bacteroidota bacterium]
MKAIRIIGIVILGLFLLAGTSLYAQDRKDKEADLKAVKEKEMQAKKEMLEKEHMEMKHQEERMREKEIQFVEQSAIFDARTMESAREPSRARVYVTSSSGDEHSYFYGHEERGSQSQLTLRNSFSGGSDASRGEFDVDKGIRQFKCMIMGKVREGEILIKVLYPGGKVFKELTITSSAEVTYTQSLYINDGSEEKYVGSWTYEVKAQKAKGNYTLSISTN